ncbi:MAG: hypothetical protein OQK44_05830 [Gammaproteobacteria bacterium]|nr:hypothetical protein [Gammaproteobacteria bacterium]
MKHEKGCRSDGLFYIHGWMGRYYAPAKSALPPSMAVVFLREPGMAVRRYPWMDGMSQ